MQHFGIRRLPLAMVAFATVGLIGCPSKETAESLLERHARFARAADAAPLQSIETRVRVTEPTFAVSGHYRAKRPDTMRVDIYAGEQRVFTEALDAGSGWQLGGGPEAEVSPVSDKGISALLRGIHGNLYSLEELPSLGYTIALKGLQDLPPAAGAASGTETERFWRLDLTTPDGRTDELYLDLERCQVRRMRRLEALHPDIDPTESITETVYSEYREIDGHLQSFLIVKRALETGEVMQTITVDEVVINPELDSTIFNSPTD